MLAAGIKDVTHCLQGNHMFPREEMTQMLNDNGKNWRRVCKTCKEETLDRRAKAKK